MPTRDRGAIMIAVLLVLMIIGAALRAQDTTSRAVFGACAVVACIGLVFTVRQRR